MRVNVVLPALSSTVTSAIVTLGWSLSTIVPIPWSSAIVALTGLDRSILNVSSNSSIVSSIISTVILAVV